MSDYLSQVLGDDHPLDDWLKTQARRAQGLTDRGTARTYVWTRPGSPDVLAYFSIAPTQVVRAEVPSKLTGGYSVIPAYLLARLALDSAFYRSHDFTAVSGSPRLYRKVATAETILAKAP